MKSFEELMCFKKVKKKHGNFVNNPGVGSFSGLTLDLLVLKFVYNPGVGSFSGLNPCCSFFKIKVQLFKVKV